MGDSSGLAADAVVALVVESRVLLLAPFVPRRPALLHREHVLHELIDRDLGALIEPRRLVRLEVRRTPV